LAYGFGFLVWFTAQVQAYAIGSGTTVRLAGYWLWFVWFLVAVTVAVTGCGCGYNILG